MQKIHSKYFWNGIENTSQTYRLRRIIEYAWFPDILRYPYSEFQEHIHEIDLSKLRTSEKRIRLFRALLPYFERCNSWDELFDRFIEES
jgi:hypothetical protein